MKRSLLFLISYFLFLISAHAEVVLQRGNVDVVSTESGWQVINRLDGTVLAYGDSALDPDNLAPAFLYMVEQYANAPELATVGSKLKVKRKAFQNISPLCTSKWAQGSPYYNKCPMYGGSRCVTGCVATAMAQVLYFHKLPKTMRGSKTYGYQNQGNQRVNLSFDYGATTFDWANMKDSYSMTSSSAAKEAVATLMYACGVGSNMRYTTGESGTNTWVGADAINCFMDGIRAEHCAFSADVVNAELQAGRPIIYAGASTSGGAHCFVIDGSNTNGYFHCNLGWGGGSDGYYLPTDMCGYGASNQELVRVYPSNEVPTYTPMAELQDKYVKASKIPASTIEENKWYVMWNAGRAGSPMSNGVGKEVTNTSSLPTGESTIYCAPQLVRFVPNSAGTSYYIQTGLGDYWSTFGMWGGSGKTTSNRSATFTKGAIRDDYFWLKSSTGAYLDTNGPGSTVVGWNNQAPTDTVSNSSWRFFAVTISDEADNPLPKFDAEATYTLKNTGYSQGYLVAITAGDEHPTLRGVTQDHSAGLYTGALYHEAADMKSDGTYWRITREGDRFYLKNELTGKYLTNQGYQTTYAFTDTKAALNIAKCDDGTYTINAGTDPQSYLCAATHLENPAAYWTADDAGSIWTIEAAEKEVPEVSVTGLTLSADSQVLTAGKSFTLTATIQPANATDNTILWTTSDASVATVNAGVVTAVGSGKAIITAKAQANAQAMATCEVHVLGSKPVPSMADFRDDAYYTLKNTGYSQGYLVVTGEEDTHPTLRGITTAHPSHGCCDEHYFDAPDFLSKSAYWRIFSEGNTRYLYNPTTQKYLANEGDETCYVFTEERTPINVTLKGNSVYYFNTGTHARSYLCAATHLENPAAFWNTMDVGTYWLIEEVEWDDQTTGIDAVAPETPANLPLNGEPGSPVYNLQGVRACGTARGIYISNRKKIIR